jgi:hypothetical protein
MRRYAAFAAVLTALLAGCSSYYTADLGKPIEFASTADPKQLVRCVTLNARNVSGAYSADWSALVPPGNYEAFVFRTYSPVYYYETFIVAQTAPAPGGSRLLVYVDSSMSQSETAGWVARLRQGCDADVASTVPMFAPTVVPAPVGTPPASPPPLPAPRGRETRG